MKKLTAAAIITTTCIGMVLSGCSDDSVKTDMTPIQWAAARHDIVYGWSYNELVIKSCMEVITKQHQRNLSGYPGLQKAIRVVHKDTDDLINNIETDRNYEKNESTREFQKYLIKRLKLHKATIQPFIDVQYDNDAKVKINPNWNTDELTIVYDKYGIDTVLCLAEAFLILTNGSKEKVNNTVPESHYYRTKSHKSNSQTSSQNSNLASKSKTITANLPANHTEYPVIHMGAISSTYESSADRENNYIHSAALTIDGNISSCWSEGVEGLGIGEHVGYNFDGTYKVSGIKLWGGHQKSQELFYMNARPSRIRIVGNDRSVEWYTLNDGMGYYTLKFATPMYTNGLRIYIEEARSGSKWDDTCIAEVEFF